MKAKAKNSNSSTQRFSSKKDERIVIWERKFFFEGLIFAFSFLLFANSIGNDYNMDDELVTINHRLTSKGIAAIPEIFTSPYYQDDAGYSYEYRPVVLASFAIEHDVFGENPHWSHFWNVLLYSLTCLLLYRVLKLLFKDYSPIIPIAVSLLFVAHPAHTEVVCSIKNRDEILGLMFGLAAFYIILKSLFGKKYLPLVFVPILFLFALLSKITVISFTIIIPLALMLLTDLLLTQISIVAILLAFPAVLIVPLSNTFDKVLLFFALLLGVVFVFGLLHPKEIVSRIVMLNKSIYNYLFKKNNFEDIDKKGFLFSLQHAIPNRTVLLSPFSIIVVLSTYLYYWSTHNHYLLYAALIPFCFAILMWKGNNAVAWWSAVGFYLCVYLNFDSYNGGFQNVYKDVLTVFLFYQIFKGDRRYLIPLILPLILFAYHCYVIADFSDLVLNSIMFVLIAIKPIRYLLFIVFLGVQIYSLKNVVWTEPETYYAAGMAPALFVLFIYTFQKNKIVSALIWLLPFISLVLFNFYSIRYHSQILNSGAIAKIESSVNLVNTQVVSTKQNRPLNYVEQCVDKNDPLTIRIGTSLSILSHYLQKVIIPYPLSFYYGYSFIKCQSVFDVRPAFSLIFYFILFLFGFFLVRKNPIMSFALFFYLLSVILFSNFIGYVPGMLADRFLLIPSLAWSIFLVVTIALLFSVNIANSFKSLGAIPVFSKYAFLLVLVSYSLLTFSRNMDWKDYLTLARHDIKYVNNSSQAHNLLGLRLMKESYQITYENAQNLMHQEALLHFKRAVEIYPPFFNATYDIARVYSILNQTDSAILYYQKTLQLDSAFTNAYMALGEIYFQQQRLDDARINFEKLILAFPTNSVGYDKVSYIYFLQKEYLKSIAVNKVAMEKMPSDPQPCIAIAKAFYTMQQFDSSRLYLKKAIQINPSHQEANALLQNLNSR